MSWSQLVSQVVSWTQCGLRRLLDVVERGWLSVTGYAGRTHVQGAGRTWGLNWDHGRTGPLEEAWCVEVLGEETAGWLEWRLFKGRAAPGKKFGFLSQRFCRRSAFEKQHFTFGKSLHLVVRESGRPVARVRIAHWSSMRSSSTSESVWVFGVDTSTCAVESRGGGRQVLPSSRSCSPRGSGCHIMTSSVLEWDVGW